MENLSDTARSRSSLAKFPMLAHAAALVGIRSIRERPQGIRPLVARGRDWAAVLASLAPQGKGGRPGG